MKRWMIGVVVLVVIAVGVGAFFGGRASVEGTSEQAVGQGLALGQGVAGEQSAGNGSNRSGFPSDGSGFAGGRGGNVVSGTIIAVDETGITVQTEGGSKIVLVAPSTAIVKTEEATQQDLVMGEQVMVTGTSNEDGSVTASRIQLGSALLGGGQSSSGSGQAPDNGSSSSLPVENAPSSTTTTLQ